MAGATRRALAALTLTAALATGATAQAPRLRLDVSAEARVFSGRPLFGEQHSARLSPSLVFRPQGSLDAGGGAWRISGEGFLRVDAHDGRRTHADVRELGARWSSDRVTVFVGAGRVFWGVTEVRHLVDIVNQTDAVEDLDEKEKLGQPMVRATLHGAWGALEAILLPWFRERTFPAAGARLRGPLPVSDDAEYESGWGRWHPDVAFRWYRPVGPFEVGATFFRGTSREPRLVPATGGEELVPWYDRIAQAGLDVQWTGDATLVKLETVTRGGHGSRFWAATAGLEHTFWGVLGSAGDLSVLLEVMTDRRSEAAPPTFFDRDVFAGVRWARNDPAATALLAGAVVDGRSGETLALVEADRRVGDQGKVSVEVRAFTRTRPGSPAHPLRRDGFLNLRLTRYF